MRAAFFLMLICAVRAAPLHADMVTLRTNKTWYGTILGLTSDKLTLRAEFPNNVKKDLVFDRDKLAHIEFNDQKLNVGDPGQEAFGSHPGSSAKGGSGDSRPNDTVILEGGQPKACPSTVIDEKTIKCGDTVYDRSERAVWRILFAHS